MQVQHPRALSPERTVLCICSRANNILVGRFAHHFNDFVSVRRACPPHATGGPLLRVDVRGSWRAAFFADCQREELREWSLSSCRLISVVWLCVPRSGSDEMSWAAELELRRPYVTAHRALPFASAAQQQAPAPRGPILSELASVNGRGGGVLLEKGALKLLEWKTPPRRGGAPGGKLTRLRSRLPLPWPGAR